MPALDMDVKVRVEDDSEEEKITAGSIVTITTTLTSGDIIDAAERGEVGDKYCRRMKKVFFRK